jgi:hypothetical protein
VVADGELYPLDAGAVERSRSHAKTTPATIERAMAVVMNFIEASAGRRSGTAGTR